MDSCESVDSIVDDSNSLNPSIFEVLAQENLSIGMRDALRHFIKILAESFPEQYGSFLQYFEETYTMIDFVFSCAHFRMHGATFAEHFYSMRREPDARSSMVSFKKILAWTFLSALLPYMRLQSENIFKLVREQEATGMLQRYKKTIQTIALLYKKLFPLTHFAWEATILCYYMAYALDKTKYHSPLLHITSTRLVSSHSMDFLPDSWEEKLLRKHGGILPLVWKGLRLGIGSITLSISVGAYFLEFLEWWYSREGSTRSIFPMPIPPPPRKWPINLSLHLCPICKGERTNDTVLSCSGFVFCYPCIFKFVKEKSVCPVTGYSASLDQLIKIYHGDTDIQY